VLRDHVILDGDIRNYNSWVKHFTRNYTHACTMYTQNQPRSEGWIGIGLQTFPDPADAQLRDRSRHIRSERLTRKHMQYTVDSNRWCSGEANDLSKFVVPFPVLVPLFRLETVPPLSPMHHGSNP
jgi:hypothetical protein